MNIVTESTADLGILLNESYSNLIHSLEVNRITPHELLLSNPLNISRKINRSSYEIERFINEYRRELAMGISLNSGVITNETYWEVLQQRSKQVSPPACLLLPAAPEPTPNSLTFTTGDDNIDSVLNGGIPTGGYLVEVTGGSATGKSNFLMNLSISIQLPKEFGGLGCSIFESTPFEKSEVVNVMYITTESPLSTPRLTQINKRYVDLLVENGITDSRFHPHLDNVITPTTSLSDLESQDHCLFVQLPIFLERNSNIKMVILDSLTHHIRSELDDYSERLNYIVKTSTFLKRLAGKHSVTFVVANQVTDKPIFKGSSGIGNSDPLFLTLNSDYQMGWLYGWEDIGIVYRQLLCEKGSKKGEEFDFLDDADLSGYSNSNTNDRSNAVDNGNGGHSLGVNDSYNRSMTISNHIKNERKKLFDSNYKLKMSNITTIPALGLNWLNFVDVRICLTKSYKPILNELLIDELSRDLGIDTSIFETTNNNDETNNENNNNENNNNLNTQTNNETTNKEPTYNNETSKNKRKTLVDMLTSNEYLVHNNFENQRFLKVVFSPLVKTSTPRECQFEVWNGGIRSV